MIDFPYIRDICQTTDSKIVLLVVDGLGGLPHPSTKMSELETANLPNLDRLAQISACGLTTPVLPGVTPGSGPGHMALFGYDPVEYLIGRGVLEAIGIGVKLGRSDVAARGNFCTVDKNGLITDRRAGRIKSEESAKLVAELAKIKVHGVTGEFHPVKDHRFVLVLKGKGLSEEVGETDPQAEGVAPLDAIPLDDEADATAEAVNMWVSEARMVLKGRDKANMVLLRGFSQLPSLPDMGETYAMKPAAIAAYPMYRGLAQLCGMTVIPTGTSFDDELDTLEANWDKHDFFFLHYKPADAAGEDGNFEAKIAALEELDKRIPRLVNLGADTLVIAGDHSTPAVIGAHSWHPVPLMVHSMDTKGEGIDAFNERQCANGSIGRIPATSVMMLAMAHAGKLAKFGP
ncbi:MAG: 2,3-bisphosphoglycerate-independent phosphoglycerate mutase [SAR202 cluster bacterium]|nr:2,3-bisphosphoglycerate-independent phosphoglycerate mutase [SAR202 cluster bacterium]